MISRSSWCWKLQSVLFEYKRHFIISWSLKESLFLYELFQISFTGVTSRARMNDPLGLTTFLGLNFFVSVQLTCKVKRSFILYCNFSSETGSHCFSTTLSSFKIVCISFQMQTILVRKNERKMCIFLHKTFLFESLTHLTYSITSFAFLCNSSHFSYTFYSSSWLGLSITFLLLFKKSGESSVTRALWSWCYFENSVTTSEQESSVEFEKGIREERNLIFVNLVVCLLTLSIFSDDDRVSPFNHFLRISSSFPHTFYHRVRFDKRTQSRSLDVSRNSIQPLYHLFISSWWSCNTIR